jgi:hypothetical protein
MGGKYPSGGEYNFNFDGTAKDTISFMNNCPKSVPMIFTGFEFGENVITGKQYKQAPDSPMKKAYELAYDSINVGRPSWDQIALLYGVREDCFNGKKMFELDHGINSIADNGTNKWISDSTSIHAYLKPAIPETEIADIIEKLMIAEPMCI